MSLEQMNLDCHVSTLGQILFQEDLKVPEYQRPYKWSIQNVNSLLDDILLNVHKSAYRLGTIVVHRSDGLNIVDGQQRLLTVTLLAAELLKQEEFNLELKLDKLALRKHVVADPISLENLQKNQACIQNRLKEFDKERVDFFFSRCEVVWIELDDISEAFQFFDAQNTRGLDLQPHDLLKAFHLREMAGIDERHTKACASIWEANSDMLPTILGQYLFRVRRWSQGRAGLNYAKTTINVFKGIKQKVDGEELLFERTYRMLDRHSINGHELVPDRYPFQLDQPIVNGRRFFDFVGYYSVLIGQIMNLTKSEPGTDRVSNILMKPSSLSARIIHVLNTYKGRKRFGDRYLRNMLECCLLYYLDKFGIYKIDIAFNQFFFWVYAIRLEKLAVHRTTIDTLAREESGFFRLIRDAVHPTEFINRELHPVNYLGAKKSAADIEGIVALFKEQQTLNYGL